MSVRRTILKKTVYFAKGSVATGGGAPLLRYLKRYMDEIGKALQKSENWRNPKTQKSIKNQWLLPKERTGILYTGGFFGDVESPGSLQPREQRKWIRKFTDTWVDWLTPRTKRTTDGFRFMMSLSTQAVAQLNESKQSVDQAMREIWRETLRIYRHRHGFENPEDDVAWICGAHHDTEHTHIHIVLFPTTKSGKILRTNNARIVDRNNPHQRINDLNDFSAMTNIAAEKWWRQNMQFHQQAPDFVTLLSLDPEQEPPLPTLNDFDAPSGIDGTDYPNKQTKPKIRTKARPANKPLLDLHDTPQNYRQNGVIKILKNLKTKISRLPGVTLLKAYTGLLSIWKNRKRPFYEILGLFEKKQTDGPIRKALQQDFPQETEAFDRLKTLEGLLTSKRAKIFLKDILGEKATAEHMLFAFIAGQAKDPTNIEALNQAKILAEAHETRTKYKLMWDQGTWQGKEKTKERKRESNYLDLLRAIRSAERKHKVDLTDAKAIVKAIIKGSRLLSQCFEGRHRETRKALKWGKQGPEPRSEMREWAFENGEFVIKKNTGKPWPDHLDPETCIKPLQNNEKPTQVTPPDFNSIKKHLTNDLWLLSDDTHENPLDTIVRKNFERQRTMDDQIRQNVPRILDEGKDTPDEPPTSPTHDQTETNPPDRTEPDRQTNTRTDPEDPGI
jgi:hypothetical protein